ncbi:uncharacterized protein LOC111249617 isoform X2 [Varroa destructor]|uniref:Uncharacterized protein n=1 Tax=Varroa destructor TaxID=109461 RepID=A0A7M7K2A7_VARDE|nr:uncharacterized protein LOC111249617 isoform X2 [Varroa destructor]
MLAYVVYKILNKHQLLSSSLLDGKYSDADEQKATVLSLDYDSYMDLQCISAGNIPRTNGVESLLNHVGASIVFTLMGFPGLAEAGFRSPSRIKISSNQRFSSMQLAKRFLKLTTSSRCLSVALPDVLKALPIATRINCFQEIVQEMAEMLLATQSADMYYSAKVLTGLDTTWRRDFIQRWILQLVNNSDNTRTLDPIRALERCRRLPKTIDEFEEKTTAENRQNFSLRQATALGGPDVAIVLAFFMASPKPLSLNELETRFLKLRGATLPLSAVHILHEMGAIQTVPFETRNRGTENASPRFDVQEFCRIVRGLIRQMNHDPNAVYYLTLATGKNALPCLPYSCTRRRSIACLLEKYGVSQFPDLDAAHMLEDFAAFFEKLQLARDDKVALADCYNGYRLRECVVFPRRVPDKENINGTKSCSAEENCNRKHKHLSQTALQASGNSEQQRPTTATKGRRALRLAAIFPY